jgi:ADP-ribosyl-[dinitrogen reductase] hydrolase
MNPSALTLADRIRGCLWGEFVGDAICLGSHWIYNLGEMEQKFPGGPKGFEAPAEGHYHYPKEPGDLTHYGEGALVMLESIAAQGRLDLADYWLRFFEHFGSPEYIAYLDLATKGTLENFACFEEEDPNGTYHFQGGADDDQMSTVSRFAPVVVAHRDDPALLDVIEQCTRVCQNNDRAVAYAKVCAIVMQDLLNGQDFNSAFHHAREVAPGLDPILGPEVRRKIDAGITSTLDETTLAIQKFGQACPLPQSFPAATICAAKHSHSFSKALLANLRAGGDNAGRGALIGAWLGALHGYAAIPSSWAMRLRAAPRIEVLVERVISRAMK